MLVAICGRKRVGKDTLADYLSQNFNYKKVSFAEPIKYISKYLFDLTDEEIENKEEKLNSWNFTARDTFLSIGNLLRQINLPGLDNIWNYKVEKEISSCKKIVISDLRYLHEANLIRRYGGIIIKIKRDSVPKSVLEDEVDLIEADLVLENLDIQKTQEKVTEFLFLNEN